MGKALVICDFKKKTRHNLDVFDADRVLSLSPCSEYLLEKSNYSYVVFHDLVSEEQFRDRVLSLFSSLQSSLNSYYLPANFNYFVIQLLSFNSYLEVLQEYMNKFDLVTVITDDVQGEVWSFLKSQYANLTLVSVAGGIDQVFYKKVKRKLLLEKVRSSLIKKGISLLRRTLDSYDASLSVSAFPRRKIECGSHGSEFKSSLKELSEKLNVFLSERFVNYVFDSRALEFNFEEKRYFWYGPFVFVSDINSAYNLFCVQKNNFPVFLFQHGSYLYKNVAISGSEIKCADVNFVINDYTKDFFNACGAKNIINIGSKVFNRKIKSKAVDFDFLYITQGHDYLGSKSYVDFPNSMHSMDGHGLYSRHKEVIELFGEHLKSYRICIKLHPLVVTSGLYVPIWELSDKYENILVEFATSTHKLIERSKYIISDYFTSEFLNNTIHYEKDILLFQGAPTPLPAEVEKDFQELFILIDTVPDLAVKVQCIDAIIKNRIKNDEIIEYYSSKRCDSKNIVKNSIRTVIDSAGR